MTDAALAEYPKTVVLKDGAHLVLRPVTPAERDAVARLLPDGGTGGAAVVAAWAGDEIAAVARLEGTAADTASVAVALAPAYRGRRLGTWMLLDCVHLAGALGFARLEAVVARDDDGQRAAFRRLDFVEERADAATVVLAKTLHAAWTDF